MQPNKMSITEITTVRFNPTRLTMLLRITHTECQSYTQTLPKGTIPVPLNETGKLPISHLTVIARELLTFYNSQVGFFDKRTNTLLIQPF